MIESMTTLSASECETLKADNRVVWGRMAATYATTFEVLTREAAPALLDSAGVGRGTDLLDVGTGPGTLVGPALGRGATVCAVDLSEPMVVAARARFPGVEVSLGDAHRLPYGDATFDAVTMGFCLHHIPAPEHALAEVRRVLRPGGRVAFAVWAPAPRLELFGMVFEVLGRLARLDGAPALQAPAIGEVPGDYEVLLEGAGFAHPSARIVDVAWELSDGSAVFEAFDGYFDLNHESERTREAIRAAFDAEVRARADLTGRARIANPAVVGSAQRQRPG